MYTFCDYNLSEDLRFKIIVILGFLNTGLFVALVYVLIAGDPSENVEYEEYEAVGTTRMDMVKNKINALEVTTQMLFSIMHDNGTKIINN